MSDNLITVGIGYSAGGLTAVEQFFEHIPDKPGLAFVVVHHMPRDYKSHLTSILPKYTTLPVISIADSIQLQPGHIYVLDENQYVKVWDSHLYFVDRPEHSEVNVAIDVLFNSMAAVKKDKAIGVIFSGTGSDGARGGHAIHEAGGKVFIQEPASAAFTTMPVNAINTDHPFSIGTPRELAEALMRFVRKRE